MDSWQAALLALGGLMLFLLIVFAVLAVASGFLRRDPLSGSQITRRSLRRRSSRPR
jgi:hypothetical protein